MTKEQMTCLIDRDLKTEFQIIAKRQHKTATEILTDLVQKYVDEHQER